jgi:hypothetical protein
MEFWSGVANNIFPRQDGTPKNQHKFEGPFPVCSDGARNSSSNSLDLESEHKKLVQIATDHLSKAVLRATKEITSGEKAGSGSQYLSRLRQQLSELNKLNARLNNITQSSLEEFVSGVDQIMNDIQETAKESAAHSVGRATSFNDRGISELRIDAMSYSNLETLQEVSRSVMTSWQLDNSPGDATVTFENSSSKALSFNARFRIESSNSNNRFNWTIPRDIRLGPGERVSVKISQGTTYFVGVNEWWKKLDREKLIISID